MANRKRSLKVKNMKKEEKVPVEGVGVVGNMYHQAKEEMGIITALVVGVLKIKNLTTLISNNKVYKTKDMGKE